MTLVKEQNVGAASTQTSYGWDVVVKLVVSYIAYCSIREFVLERVDTSYNFNNS
jgi:hypothetical protein